MIVRRPYFILLDFGHFGLSEREVIICSAAPPLFVSHDKGKGDILIPVRGGIRAGNISRRILVPVHEPVGIIIMCFVNP
jgi:hypothetical protein